MKIKLRKKGTRVYWFLTSKGRLNRLRIHASEMGEGKAVDVLTRIVADNPGFEGKVVA